MDTAVFPKTIFNLDGHTINVDELAKRYILIFVTLKATWCRVCPQLLLILNLLGLQDNPPTTFRDPFDETILEIPQKEIPFNRLLLRHDAFFIVICPGPADKVRQIQNNCNFSHYPYHFVVDEDLSLARSLNLRMVRDEIWPCIAHITDTLEVHPICYGRGPGFYGHNDLLYYLREYRIQVEDSASKLILDARKVEKRLKRSTITEDSVDDATELDQNFGTNQGQFLPTEMLAHIFDFLEPIEIVKTVIATSRLWRAIGLEVFIMNIRRGINNVSESLVTYPRTENNQMPYISRINLLKQKNKLVGIYELNQKINNLNEIVKISQCLLH